MASNIEGEAAKKLAKSETMSNLAMGALIGNVFTGGMFGKKENKNTGSSKKGGVTAEELANQELSKRYDFERAAIGKEHDFDIEQRRSNHHVDLAGKVGGDGRTPSRIKADGKGGFEYNVVNAPKSEKPAGRGIEPTRQVKTAKNVVSAMPEPGAPSKTAPRNTVSAAGKAKAAAAKPATVGKVEKPATVGKTSKAPKA